MLFKHDGIEKTPTAVSQHLLKESAVVLHDPFLLMLYIDTLVCVYLQMETKQTVLTDKQDCQCLM